MASIAMATARSDAADPQTVHAEKRRAHGVGTREQQGRERQRGSKKNWPGHAAVSRWSSSASPWPSNRPRGRIRLDPEW
jgi:hypothetical protein